MRELLSNKSLFVGQLYDDKSLALRARDLIFFTTDLQTVNYYQQFTAGADLFLKYNTCVQARLYTELRIQKLCDSFYPAFETLSVRLSLKSGNQSHFPMSND